MKKVFFSMVMAVVALSFVGCGGGNASKSIPQDMQDLTEQLEHVIMKKMVNNEIIFDEFVMEGNTLVCKFDFDEGSKGADMPLKTYLRKEVSKESIDRDFIRIIQKKIDEENLALLAKHRIDLMYRIVGSKSGYIAEKRYEYSLFGPVQGSTSATQESNGVPSDVQQFANQIEKRLSEEFADANDMYFEGVTIEGKDVVVTIEIDESTCPDNNLVRAIETEEGMSIQEFKEKQRKNIIKKKDRAFNGISVLRNYQYNFVFRFTGNFSGKRIDCKVNYYEL